MNQFELMQYARKGIEDRIQERCAFIYETWAQPDEIKKLEALIADYHEIILHYEKAHDAQIEAEWLAENGEG